MPGCSRSFCLLVMLEVSSCHWANSCLLRLGMTTSHLAPALFFGGLEDGDGCLLSLPLPFIGMATSHRPHLSLALERKSGRWHNTCNDDRSRSMFFVVFTYVRYIYVHYVLYVHVEVTRLHIIQHFSHVTQAGSNQQQQGSSVVIIFRFGCKINGAARCVSVPTAGNNTSDPSSPLRW